MADSKTQERDPGSGGVTKTGVRKNLWLHEDEAEALRRAAFDQRRSEADIMREALRQYLGIED